MDSKETNIIEVKRLVKEFNTVKAVNDISFTVRRGEIFAFLGPNGAGKTTTIKMLTTLLAPTSGNVIINSYDATHEQDNARKSFGIVFQDPSLDDELTAYENMHFSAVLYNVPAREQKQRIKTLLEFVDLWDRRDHSVKTFSGGMKRRLEVARGLIHHPKIFFLDEPTVGLDPQTRNHIWEHLKNLKQQENITIFFTTHYMEEAAEVADTVAIMDHGQLVAQGTVEDLLKKTHTKTLEQAFLSLTGREIREEEAGSLDRMRMQRKVWRGR